MLISTILIPINICTRPWCEVFSLRFFSFRKFIFVLRRMWIHYEFRLKMPSKLYQLLHHQIFIRITHRRGPKRNIVKAVMNAESRRYQAAVYSMFCIFRFTISWRKNFDDWASFILLKLARNWFKAGRMAVYWLWVDEVTCQWRQRRKKSSIIYSSLI